jgi:hypothetical protein
MIVDRILAYLSAGQLGINEAVKQEVEKIAGYSFQRQFMTEEDTDKKGKLRMSSCGKCPRQLAYSFHGIKTEGKEIDARAKLIFFAGDLCELVITNLAKLAGVVITATGLNQINLEAEMMIESGMQKVTGHPDGMVLHEGKWYLFECKSMSDFAFDRFQKDGTLDDSYIAQVNIYMHKLDLNACVVVGYDKNSGVMHEIILQKDVEVVKKAVQNLRTVLDSTPESLPERPYSPDPKTGLYPWNCIYCAHYKTCMIDSGLAEKVLVRNAWKLKAVKK